MYLDPLRAPAHHALRNFCVAFAACSPLLPAVAQTPAPAASAASTELTPAERTKRDENVFRWITIHADKPRKVVTPPVKEEKPPTVVRVKAPAPATATAPAAAPVVASNAPAPKAEVAAPAPAATPSAAVAPAVAESDTQRASVSAPAAAIANAPAVAPEVDDASDNLTLVTQVEPKFPISVVRSLRSGQVQVKFTVMPDGSVTDASVVNTTNTRLNSSALAAVAQWRFAPVRKPQQGVVELGFNNAE